MAGPSVSKRQIAVGRIAGAVIFVLAFGAACWLTYAASKRYFLCALSSRVRVLRKSDSAFSSGMSVVNRATSQPSF